MSFMKTGFTLSKLAFNISKSVNACAHPIGKYAIFKKVSPNITRQYLEQNDGDWLKYGAKKEDILKSDARYIKKNVNELDNNTGCIEISVLSWLEGAKTPIHNHSEYIATQTCILYGSLKETIYRQYLYDKYNPSYGYSEKYNIDMHNISILPAEVYHSIQCNNLSTYSLQISLKNITPDQCPHDASIDPHELTHTHTHIYRDMTM